MAVARSLPQPQLAHPAEPDVAELLATHHALMREASPAESCHVMDGAELTDADARVYALRSEAGLLGVGALAVIEPGHGELKSMHVAAAARGSGAARHLLQHVIAEATGLGLNRLSLETGSAEMFAPARGLYLSEGFEMCPPFGAYVEDPLSVFMTRAI